MSGPLQNLAPAPVKRVRAPGWRDARLWVGVLIVAVSVIAGARLLAAADDTVAVWAANGDLVAGSQVGADDVVAVRVRFRDGERLDSYLSAETAWNEEHVLLRDVAAGELVPASATGERADDQVRLLPVAVAPTQVPPGVKAGSVVDVWAAGVDELAAATSGAGDADDADDAGVAPRAGTTGALLVLEGVRVVEAPDASSQVGSIAERQLVLAVPPDQHEAIATALAALAAGTVTVSQRS